MSVFTKKEIFAQLEAMQAPTGSIVVFHSSLRAIGPVEGGAEGLLEVLTDYFTRDHGLFCVPAHTVHNVRTKEITLDVAEPDHCLGAFSTVALQSPEGVRSENPVLSLKVFGDRDRALEFIKDEPYLTSSAPANSCYGKLDSLGGQVLLAGVAHNRNTFLHAVGEILQLPNRMGTVPDHTAVRRLSGEILRQEILPYQTDFTEDVSTRFWKYETAFRYHRCITDGFIGSAPAQLCDARKMRETVELIFRNSGGIDPMEGERPIPQKFYCR